MTLRDKIRRKTAQRYMSSKLIKVENSDIVASVFGSCDSNIGIVEAKFGVAINNRVADDGSDVIVISGDDENVANAAQAVRYLVKMAKYNEVITDQSVVYVCDTVTSGRAGELEDLGDDTICVTMKGKPIKAKTVGQKHYVNAIKKNTIVYYLHSRMLL